ncbi:AAA family ATPase [bacterium]|nr:AAA family ATPase [bacterium]
MPTTYQSNPEIDTAWTALTNTQTHAFITGPAGTGKSTLLSRYLRQKDEDTGVAVVAPTGVAALNVGGETIHHFFHLRPGDTIHSAHIAAIRTAKAGFGDIFQHLDALVIDEISMVRADLFDMMDEFLRTIRRSNQSFGGVRLICFGDLYQLPPVVNEQERALVADYQSEFFFHSHAFARMQAEQAANFSFTRLKHIFRQTDPDYLAFLDKVRHERLEDSDLAFINQHVTDLHRLMNLDASYIMLTASRARAQRVNEYHLGRLKSPWKNFQGFTSGKFRPTDAPTSINLTLKEGARVMLVNNDPENRWVNGSTGTVTHIPNHDTVCVRLDDDDQIVEVHRHTWENTETYFNKQTQQIDTRVIGSFEQFPIIPAYAITIHKSQGKTFPHLAIDLERQAFAGGQCYVALSRGTTLETLHLARPLTYADVHYDQHILDFMDAFFDGNTAEQAKYAITYQVTDDGTQTSIF